VEMCLLLDIRCKSDMLQSRIDKRGNLLAKKDFDKLAQILSTVEDADERNKARSDYDAARAKFINTDALCKSWKRQKENIKKNKEQACSVVREEFAVLFEKSLLRSLPCLMLGLLGRMISSNG
jgi:hypothetical protein